MTIRRCKVRPTATHSAKPGFPAGSSQNASMVDRHSAGCNTTKQIETERALSETKRQLEAVFESMADPVIIVDARGAVIASNAAYRDVFRWPLAVRPFSWLHLHGTHRSRSYSATNPSTVAVPIFELKVLSLVIRKRCPFIRIQRATESNPNQPAIKRLDWT